MTQVQILGKTIQITYYFEVNILTRFKKKIIVVSEIYFLPEKFEASVTFQHNFDYL